MKIQIRLSLVAAFVAVLAGCERGDPVSVAGSEEGVAQLFAGSAANPSPLLPSGSAVVRTNISIATTPRDGFGRRSVDRRGRYYSPALRLWFYPKDVLRNSNPATIDPRFPFLRSTTSTVGRGVFIIPPPSTFAGADFYEVWTEGALQGLKPATQHQLVLVQYRLTINGTLDQRERLLSGTVTQPDSLFVASGTLRSTNTDWTGAAPAGCAAFPGPNTNPYVVGTEVSSGGGVLEFDKCFTPGGVLFTLAEGERQDKSPVGRNDDVAYSLPNFNYIEVWEGAYGTGTPVARIQIAQDLDAAGQPVANAFAPFPAPNTRFFNATASPNLTATSGQIAPPAPDQAPSFPLSQTALGALPGAVGPPDSVTVTLNNLQALTGAVYKAFYVNPTTNAARPAIGRFVRRVGTTTADSADNTSTFNGGPGTITFVTRPYGQIGAPDVSDSLSVLVISIVSDAAATQPSSAQPFFTNVIKTIGGTVGGALQFGAFNLNNELDPGLFRAQGQLAGGVIGDTVLVLVDSIIDGVSTKVRAAQFVGSRIEVRFTGLQRPPSGYRYAGFLCGSANELCSVTDPTTVFLNLGGLEGPGGTSLDDADLAPNSANLSSTRILEARLSYDVATEGSTGDTICDYDRFRLALVPIAGDDLPLAYIFDTLLPTLIRTARSCR